MLKTFFRRARDAKPLFLFAVMIGTLGFLLSFALAWTMWRAEGNLALLLVWIIAVVATAAATRKHLKLRDAIERIYTMNSCMLHTFRHRRSRQRPEVEDVVFREIPH